MTVFWDIAQCSLVEVDRRFRGARSYLEKWGPTGRRRDTIALLCVPCARSVTTSRRAWGRDSWRREGGASQERDATQRVFRISAWSVQYTLTFTSLLQTNTLLISKWHLRLETDWGNKIAKHCNIMFRVRVLAQFSHALSHHSMSDSSVQHKIWPVRRRDRFETTTCVIARTFYCNTFRRLALCGIYSGRCYKQKSSLNFQTPQLQPITGSGEIRRERHIETILLPS
jgi:hypothetical protein